jgi:tetratricopeptide (TPR) repeat protein
MMRRTGSRPHETSRAACAAGTLACGRADRNRRQPGREAGLFKRKPKEPPTLGELSKREAPKPPTATVAADTGQAVSSYERFLQIDDTDPAMRAQALRRLGDLRLAQADNLRAANETSDAAANATRDAIAAYRQLLKEYPGRADAGEVLYQLARAYEGLGDTTRRWSSSTNSYVTTRRAICTTKRSSAAAKSSSAVGATPTPSARMPPC